MVAPSASPAASWLTLGRFTCLLAFLLMAAYPEVVFGQGTFFFRDFGFFGYPLAHYHREAIWRGELPLWNPLNYCGLPFLAQWNTLTLYPGSLLYLLFPLSWSLGVFCLGHQLIGGAGMFWLVHRWVGYPLPAAIAGIAFACNGLMLNSLMWPNNVAALGWMPWVIGAAERAWEQGGRPLLVAGFLGALQMLTGAPEIIFLTWVIAGALWLAQIMSQFSGKIAARFSGLILFIALLTAAQLLPFFDLLAHSQRDEQFADAYGSMPGWGWANFLVPWFRCVIRFFDVPAQYSQYWTSSYYLGVGIFALALLAPWHVRQRRVAVIAAASLVSLILSLGDQAWLYTLTRPWLPGLGFMRYPIKFVIVAVFCIPILAAFTLGHFYRAGVSSNVRRACFAVGALFLALIAAIVWFDHRYPVFPQFWLQTWQSGLTRAAFLMIVLALALVVPRQLPRPRALALGLALLAAITLDLFTHLPEQNPTIPRTAYEPGLVRLNPQPRHGERRVMISPEAEFHLHRSAVSNPFHDYLLSRQALFVNCNLLDEIPKIDGLYSLYLQEMEKLIAGYVYASTNHHRSLSPLYDFLGVGHITMPGKYFDWASRPTCLPLSSIGQQPQFAADDEILGAVTGADFDPRETVYLPAESKSLIRARRSSRARIISAEFQAHAARLLVETPEPAMLVFGQAFYHRWTARVNQAPARLWRANYAFQALEIPAGRHQVRLKYKDPLFAWGCGLSGAAWLMGLTAWWRSRPKADIPGLPSP